MMIGDRPNASAIGVGAPVVRQSIPGPIEDLDERSDSVEPRPLSDGSVLLIPPNDVYFRESRQVIVVQRDLNALGQRPGNGIRDRDRSVVVGHTVVDRQQHASSVRVREEPQAFVGRHSLGRIRRIRHGSVFETRPAGTERIVHLRRRYVRKTSIYIFLVRSVSLITNNCISSRRG